MTRPRTIIGIGEAILAEGPDRVVPAGLALRVVVEAVRQGHRGIPVSRVGQDRFADELIETIRALEISTDHIQTDPDLPTARSRARPGGSSSTPRFAPNQAFDNLQWDYDLSDLAQQADVVVFGLTGSREGQSRSVVQRFLAECASALRVVDLAERNGDEIDRAVAQALLRDADLAVMDDDAMRAVLPRAVERDDRVRVVTLLRRFDLDMALLARRDGSGLTLHAHDAGDAWPGEVTCTEDSLSAAIVAFAAAVASGADGAQCIGAAQRAAAQSGDAPQSRDVVDE